MSSKPYQPNQFQLCDSHGAWVRNASPHGSHANCFASLTGGKARFCSSQSFSVGQLPRKVHSCSLNGSETASQLPLEDVEQLSCENRTSLFYGSHGQVSAKVETHKAEPFTVV